MIPRSVIFGNPKQGATSISPNGQWLVWSGNQSGVMNLWVAQRAGGAEPRQLTFSTKRGISGHRWTCDSAYLLFSQDNDGDENYRLYCVNVETGEQRCFNPEGSSRMGVVEVSRRRPDAVLVDYNRRDARHADLYTLDLKSGELTLVLENPGFSGFLVDDNYGVRYAISRTRDGGRQLLEPDQKDDWKVVSEVGPEDARTSTWTHIDAEAKTLFAIDSRGRNTAALVAIDITSGKQTVLCEDERADVGSTLTDPLTHHPVGCWVSWERPRLEVLDDSIRGDVDFLRGKGIADWGLASRTADNRTWLIGASSDTSPGTTYIYDRDKRTLETLVVHRPDLVELPLARMQPVIVKARDGLSLVSYITLPRQVDTGEPLKASRPVPLVLFAHGGPWSRDSFGFNPMNQWLANRGYAVMNVNFRGSTGFGKTFLNAGDRQWGRRMSDDLEDAVDWAIAAGIADPKRLAILGGSYGGFAVLSALTTKPGRYACGIDIFGPSNLESLLAAIPPQWENERQMLYRSVGNPTTPEGRAEMRAVSPLFAADRIADPLLVAQGSNDPRVRQIESDQLVEALVSRNIPVTYLVFPDEGHGFSREPNRLVFNAAIEAFLGKHLGGDVEPFSLEDFPGMSLRVVHGDIGAVAS